MRPAYIVDAPSFRVAVTLGETRESRVLEFKERYGRDEGSRRELRKDVAALANTFGGTLLIGIEESNDAGYARAMRLADPDVRATAAWVDQTLNAKLFPVPHYSLATISLPQLAPHDILAVNVPPFPDGLAAVEMDDESLRFPVRSEDRVRYLRAPEVIKVMTNATARRVHLALNELSQRNQRVHIASPIYLIRPETDPEYHARLRNQYNTTSWTGLNPPFPRNHVEILLQKVEVFLDAYDDWQIKLRFDRKILSVPLSAVRDVWAYNANDLGMMFNCDTLIPSVASDPVADVVLRSR